MLATGKVLQSKKSALAVSYECISRSCHCSGQSVSISIWHYIFGAYLVRLGREECLLIANEDHAHACPREHHIHTLWLLHEAYAAFVVGPHEGGDDYVALCEQ